MYFCWKAKEIEKLKNNEEFTKKDKEYIAEFIHRYETTPTPEMAREYIAIRKAQDFENLPFEEKIHPFKGRPEQLPLYYISKGISYLGQQTQEKFTLGAEVLGWGKYNVGLTSTQRGFIYPTLSSSSSNVNPLRIQSKTGVNINSVNNTANVAENKNIPIFINASFEKILSPSNIPTDIETKNNTEDKIIANEVSGLILNNNQRPFINSDRIS
ncbi:MAG: hypothetical protein QXF25_03025 [Candidatus Pacearchaeota archaeon]